MPTAFPILVIAALHSAQPAEPPLETSDDVVVTGSRSRPPPDPATIFRERCFDANRLTGRAALPVEGSGWFSLDDETRKARKISDPAIAAFEKIDAGFKVAMMLQVHERPYQGKLIQHRCSLKTFGSPEPAKLADRISRMFGGAGTHIHLQYDFEEVVLPGWTQWRWTAALAPSSQQWRVYKSGTYLFVTEDRFYDRASYLVVDLKFNKDPKRPASVMTLVHLYDPKVFCEPASRRNSAACINRSKRAARAR